MCLKKKGEIKSYVTTVTQNGKVYAEQFCRSITFINTGGSVVTLYDAPNDLTLGINSSFTLGGYDDSFRNEEITVSFAGGVGVLKVIRDKQLTKPE